MPTPPPIEYTTSGQLLPEELGRLLFSASQSTYSQEQLERVISGSTAYITARDAGVLVGFGRLLSDGAVVAYINNMAVASSHQRRGIGQTLLRQLIAAAGQVKSVFLYSDTADALYLRHGFERSEKRLYVYRDARAALTKARNSPSTGEELAAS